jgi:hypothetical protein
MVKSYTGLPLGSRLKTFDELHLSSATPLPEVRR